MIRDRETTSRRDFLLVATGTASAMAIASELMPWLHDVDLHANLDRFIGSTTEVDLAPVREGQEIVVKWRGKPVHIRHRTAREIQEARSLPLDEMVDQKARNAALGANASAEDKNRTLNGYPQWLVVVGICTHLGCSLKGSGIGEFRGDYGGWFCTCHGAHFDASGRTRKGPAPTNLEVPPYEFASPTSIRIG